MEIICSEVICLSLIVLKRKTNNGKNGQKISQHTFFPVSANHFWMPDNGNSIYLFILYVSVYGTGHSHAVLQFCKY